MYGSCLLPVAKSDHCNVLVKVVSWALDKIKSRIVYFASLGMACRTILGANHTYVCEEGAMSSLHGMSDSKLIF